MSRTNPIPESPSLGTQHNPDKDGVTLGLFQPRWRGSVILLLAEILTNVLLFFHPMTWAGMIYGTCQKGFNRRSETVFPRWCLDLWVLSMFAAECLALYLVGSDQSHLQTAGIAIGAFGLFEAVGVISRDLIVGPYLHGGMLLHGEPRRWLLLALINLFQTIIAYSCLYLYFGTHFDPELKDATSAMYFSAVTFITLGYGDYKPADETGKQLVLGELVFVCLFLLTKLPMAVSVIKTAVAEGRKD